MIFDEVAEIMSSANPSIISQKTGLSVSKIKRLREGCPFVLDYNTLFALEKLGYKVEIKKLGREKLSD